MLPTTLAAAARQTFAHAPICLAQHSSYSIYARYISKSVQKKLQKLPDPIAEKLESAMLALENDPRPTNCKKLRAIEAYRIRVDDYRIIYEIQDDILIIVVLKIGHRKDIYRQ